MTVRTDRFEVRTNDRLGQDALKGFTLILPCVSIGSVPQLAVDVLLRSENGRRFLNDEEPVHVCDLDPRFCLPFVGSSSSSTPRTALQVYAFPKARLAVVQQRSPVLKSHKHAFVDDLSAWIIRRGIGECLVLASADAALRGDEELRQSNPLWVVHADNKAQSRLSDSLSTLLPRYTAANDATSSSYPPPMSSAGLASRLLRRSVRDWPSTSALLVFSAEGDNRAEAMLMAAAVLRATTSKQLDSTHKLVEPEDWRSLFGAPIQPGMF
jgi:proteasome assembly chaperone 2